MVTDGKKKKLEQRITINLGSLLNLRGSEGFAPQLRGTVVALGKKQIDKNQGRTARVRKGKKSQRGYKCSTRTGTDRESPRLLLDRKEKNFKLPKRRE